MGRRCARSEAVLLSVESRRLERSDSFSVGTALFPSKSLLFSS